MTDAASKRRWFRLTPGAIVIGLLAVEGLLFLSERFHWFPFNAHKGWTVLIAVAAVGAGALLMLVWWAVAIVFRWRFQFSIRSLLVLTVVVAVACSWLTWEMKEARRQREAIAKLRAGVLYDYQCDPSYPYQPFSSATPPEPGWLRGAFGEDFFSDAVALNLGFSQVTDTDLEHLKELNEVQALYLNSTYISDAGLENLKWLPDLQSLGLANTRITDAGLQHVRRLAKLRGVNITLTDATNEGAEKLKQTLPNCKVYH
jgi:hypothetical protein